MINYLTKSQIIHAVWMWSKGNDTLTIARYFKIPEHYVYSELPAYRKHYGKIKQKAA